MILGDIEGNLKLVQISEKKSQKTDQYGIRLDTLVGADNATSFKSVNDLVWTHEGTIICVGNDNSLSLIEPSTLQSIFRINTQYSTPLKIGSRHRSNQCTLIGFEDGNLRLFDLRSNQKKAQKLFKSHSQMISSVDFCPYEDNLFISGALDGVVKVWDMRSDLPLYSVNVAQNSKIFSVKWVSGKVFVSGGDDSSLTQHVLGSVVN